MWPVCHRPLLVGVNVYFHRGSEEKHFKSESGEWRLKLRTSDYY